MVSRVLKSNFKVRVLISESLKSTKHFVYLNPHYPASHACLRPVSQNFRLGRVRCVAGQNVGFERDKQTNKQQKLEIKTLLFSLISKEIPRRIW